MTWISRRGRHILFPAASLAIVLTAAGCAGSGSLRQANHAYDQGKFDEARQTAEQAAAKPGGADRYQAAYLAGVSAYRMGDFARAESNLTAATYSPNQEVAGRANATLGLLRLSEGRTAQAAPFFRAAASQLPGDEATLAARRAADCYEQAGRHDDALAMRRLAESRGGGIRTSPTAPGGSAPALRGVSTTSGDVAPSGSGLFTIQIGAFSTAANAQTAASNVRSAAARQGLGEPRITPIHRDGRTLHLVQVGDFTTKSEAEAARARLGARDAIIASAHR